MAGQVIKRGDRTWLVRIFLGRDELGSRRYLNKTIKGAKKDAQKYLNATLTAISSGNFVQESGISLNKFLDDWLESAAKPRVSERTFAEYAALLKRYVREPLGKTKLSDLRALQIQSLYSQMQERGLSSRIVRYTHAVLSSALKQAVRWGMLHRNPAELVQLPKLKRKEMRAMSPDESTRFLTALEHERYAALFSLALSTGMRPEEYLGLRWSGIDFAKSSVTVQRALVWRTKGGGWYFTEPRLHAHAALFPFPRQW